MRRMDRYYKEDENQPSRMAKNQELYQNFSNNMIYTNITDVANANAYDITNKAMNTQTTHTTREDYQQMQKYQNTEDIPHSKKELEDFNYLYQKRESKIYDINSVLEEARKNRQEKDENEGKRKLKNNAYNILAGVNRKELEKYREEKKKHLATPEEEEIRELIDTIASKTLAGEIDKATSVDLLSDLMATSIMDKVDSSENITEENLAVKEEEKKEEDSPKEEKEEDKNDEKEEEKKEEEVEEKTEDQRHEFYSKSMDLSDKDLDISEDFKEASLSLPMKLLILLVILAIVAVTFYFIYQKIH